MSMRMRWLVRELPRLAERACPDRGYRMRRWPVPRISQRSAAMTTSQVSSPMRCGRATRENGACRCSLHARKPNPPELLKEPVEILFVWHVLEHIERPAEFIEEYSRWLAPSGVMVISVPNQGSIQTRLFGYFSAYPDYGRHIWYHTTDYLNWFVSECAGARRKNSARSQLRIRSILLGRTLSPRQLCEGKTSSIRRSRRGRAGR